MPQEERGEPRIVPGIHRIGNGLINAYLLVGDAFVTRNVATGRVGPHFATRFNADNRQAAASLARFDSFEAAIVLPGHGDPFRGGPGEAVRLVRASVPAGLRG